MSPYLDLRGEETVSQVDTQRQTYKHIYDQGLTMNPFDGYAMVIQFHFTQTG